MTQDKLNINNIDFRWGMTFNQVVDEFNSQNLFSAMSAWKNFEIPCSEIAELKTLSCSFRAPSLKKPVMQVSFELETIKPNIFEKPYTPYVRHLTQILGKPHGISKNALDGQKYNKGYASSQVMYNCKWWLGDILISLSVFGGIRTRKEGEYAAGLYFDWLNEKRIAEPYFEEFVAEESELSSTISDLTNIKMNYDFRPYHKKHYELNIPDQALHDQEIRTAQLILYADKLFRTPKTIAKEMTDKEIVLFKSHKTNNWCIGNKWDFTPINEDSTLNYIDIKPARGSGGTEMKINSLNIQDKRDSEILNNLSMKIEELTARKFERSTGYDD